MASGLQAVSCADAADVNHALRLSRREVKNGSPLGKPLLVAKRMPLASSV